MSAPRFNLPRRVLLGLLFAVGIVVVLIWLFSVAIPNPQVLLPEATSEPDQRTIMIMSNRDGDWDIYEVALADGSAVNLTADDDPQSADGFGSYSSDGGAVSFLSSRNGELEAFNMNADGAISIRWRTICARLCRLSGRGASTGIIARRMAAQRRGSACAI